MVLGIHMIGFLTLTNKKISPASSYSLNTEKKAWRQPQIMKLNVQDTKGGRRDLDIEFEWFFISLHS